MNDNPSEYETYIEVDEHVEDLIETCEDELCCECDELGKWEKI
jgi:hypothetical protein